jgi:hypothetical protein
MTRHASRSRSPAPVRERTFEILAGSFEIDRFRLTKTAVGLVMEGYVPSYRMKKLAGLEAVRLLRAPHVVNRLRVVPQNHRRDTELVEAVQAALVACSHAGEHRIAILTQNGVVILQGIVCCSPCRSQAEAAAWAVGGVVDVVNRLRVVRSPARHDREPVPSFLRKTRRYLPRQGRPGMS